MVTPFLSNKRYLLLTDSLTPLVQTAIDSIIISGGSVVCVTSSLPIKEAIQTKIGVPAVHVKITSGKEVSFYENHMPGSMEDTFIESFPVWKGLSMDRLRFWHVNKDDALSLLDRIKYDEAIIDLDLESNISAIYEDLDCPIIGLKNKTLRTTTHLSFLKEGDLSTIVTDKEYDIKFIAGNLSGITTLVWKDGDPLVLPTERDREKKGTVVYYDKEYVWQFDMYNKYTAPHDIVTYDNRSMEVFPLCHPDSKQKIKPAYKYVDTLILFAYDEEVIEKIDPNKVFIYDPYGVNQSRKMSAGDNRVEVHFSV